jgi:chromosomal replication initiation ATPase DnaA
MPKSSPCFASRNAGRFARLSFPARRVRASRCSPAGLPKSGLGEAIDDADTMDEDALFHRWNRAQELRQPLLIVSNAGEQGWKIRLPDLASRLGAALQLEIGPPDDAMLADLILLHAEMRSLPLDESATAYLVGRCVRSHLGVEQLVAAIDRISLERKQAPSLAVWREALEEIAGPDQPRLL